MLNLMLSLSLSLTHSHSLSPSLWVSLSLPLSLHLSLSLPLPHSLSLSLSHPSPSLSLSLPRVLVSMSTVELACLVIFIQPALFLVWDSLQITLSTTSSSWLQRYHNYSGKFFAEFNFCRWSIFVVGMGLRHGHIKAFGFSQLIAISKESLYWRLVRPTYLMYVRENTAMTEKAPSILAKTKPEAYYRLNKL